MGQCRRKPRRSSSAFGTTGVASCERSSAPDPCDAGLRQSHHSSSPAISQHAAAPPKARCRCSWRPSRSSRPLCRAACSAASPKGASASPLGDQRLMEKDSPSLSKSWPFSHSRSRGNRPADWLKADSCPSAVKSVTVPRSMPWSKRIKPILGMVSGLAGICACARAGPRYCMAPRGGSVSVCCRERVWPSRRLSWVRLVSVVHSDSPTHHRPFVKRYVPAGVRAIKLPCASNSATAWPPPVATAKRPLG